MDIKRFSVVLLLGVLFGWLGTIWYQAICKEAAAHEVTGLEESIEDSVSVKWRQDHFILNDENLFHELKAQGVDYPEIVLAQAKLETGHYKSNACTQKNNLFGLRAYSGSYMHFGHWTDCVAAYKKYIQKYDSPPNDYYGYLDTLGYAEDKSYIIKLKQIVNNE